MVEGARLEIVYAATYRGFESPSLRHELIDETHHFDRRKEARSLGRAGHFAFLRAPESAIRGGGVILPNSSKERAGAIQDESEAILRRLKPDDVVILLDERGKNMSSPELSELILAHTDRHIVLIIGGAYGVNEEVRRRADVLWSLSRLVFPHQLVRLIVSEQLYRAQEIARGGKYHHE